MPTTRFALFTLTALLLAGLVACGDNGGGDDSACTKETVAGLSKYTSDRDSADHCVEIDGVVSFGTTKQCPGGYFLRDSSGASEFIYLANFTPDTTKYPENDTIFKKVRVEGNYRPGEVLCDSLLCHCQRKLTVISVGAR